MNEDQVKADLQKAKDEVNIIIAWCREHQYAAGAIVGLIIGLVAGAKLF